MSTVDDRNSSRPRLFLDTGDLAAVRAFGAMIEGVTTTPTILRRDRSSTEDFIKAIRSEFPTLEIHIEALGDDVASTLARVDQIRSSEAFDASLIVFKVPITSTGIAAVRRLRSVAPEVRVNIHLIFSRAQAILGLREQPAYIAPLLGRYRDWLTTRPAIADTALGLVRDILSAKAAAGSDTTVLVTSIRTVEDLVDSAMLGVDAIAVPPHVMESALQHDLTDVAIRQFREDQS